MDATIAGISSPIDFSIPETRSPKHRSRSGFGYRLLFNPKNGFRSMYRSHPNHPVNHYFNHLKLCGSCQRLWISSREEPRAKPRHICIIISLSSWVLSRMQNHTDQYSRCPDFGEVEPKRRNGNSAFREFEHNKPSPTDE